MRRFHPDLALRWPVISKQRFEKRIKREQKQASKKSRPKSQSLGAHNRSRILDFCSGRIKGKPCFTLKKHTARIRIPKVFSFIDNPDATLDVIYTISLLSRNKSVRTIFLDHWSCEIMDMGASICLDILCMEIWKEWTQRGAKRSFEGTLPQSDPVEYIIRGTGLVKHLKIASHQLPNELASKFLYFPFRKGYKPVGSLTKSTSAEKTSQDLALYFDGCLRSKGFNLTAEGLKYICNLVGEVIDNAEEHSGQRQWFAVGYMDQSAPVGECQLAIINFGHTIYESLNQPETPALLKKEIADLSDRHSKRGLFDFATRWTEENLWTLYALQDGVSRWSGTNQGRDRGTGTIKMIEFFQVLGETQAGEKHPQMTLVSGHTRILFDHLFKLETIVLGNETRKLMTFNSSKSLDDRPSEQHVHSIDGYFPGTIISLRFYIDRAYLEALKGQVHANNTTK